MQNLKINPPFNNATNFYEFIELMIEALGIPNQLANKIKENMTKLTTNNQLSLVMNDNIRSLLRNALEEDKKLNQLDLQIPESVKSQWETTKQLLGELQGLILLKSTQVALVKDDNSDLIKNILEAFNMKLTAVNSILVENLITKPTLLEPSNSANSSNSFNSSNSSNSTNTPPNSPSNRSKSPFLSQISQGRNNLRKTESNTESRSSSPFSLQNILGAKSNLKPIPESQTKPNPRSLSPFSEEEIQNARNNLKPRSNTSILEKYLKYKNKYNKLKLNN